MPEFKRGGHTTRKDRQELIQDLRIHFHIRRKLEQDRPHLACLREWLNGSEETRDKIFCVLQAFDMRNHLMCLDAESKMRRRLRDPLLRRRIFQ